MSNIFNNFLGGVVKGTFGDGPIMRDYQHADRLYVKNGYINAPKFGFLFYVEFNINTSESVKDKLNALGIKDVTNKLKDVGLLVKKIDLPKFSIVTETLNQYNRRTVVQTGIKYNAINIEFHDDNGNITRDLWKSYYQYYYQDTTTDSTQTTRKFKNTKYSETPYDYGLNSTQTVPFFDSITVYVLHQQRYSKFKVINPLITEWSHDIVDYSAGDKIMSNKMTIAYEAVEYGDGVTSSQPTALNKTYYDNTPSPLSVGGNGTNTIFGKLGVLSGASDVLGTLEQGNILGAAIKGVTLAKNISSINKASLKSEAYSVINGALGGISINNIPPTSNSPGIQTGVKVLGDVNIQTAVPKNLLGK